MTTLREEKIKITLKRMKSYKRNCERAGRPYSGYLGVSYCIHNKKYRVYIGNKMLYGGTFDSAIDAAIFYDTNVTKVYSDAITNKELGLLKHENTYDTRRTK